MPGPGADKIFDVRVDVPATLVGAISSVTITSGKPVVSFSVRDSLGRGAVGLKAGSSGQLRFGLAKLTPGTGGDSSAWQGYIVRSAAVGTGTEMQTTVERTGTLVDNGDGTYVYTFATDVTAVTNPVTGASITFDGTLTHRLGMQVSGTPAGGIAALPPANAVYDFVPNGGAVSFTREIVKIDACNSCHGQLRLHGSRIETKYCVACHNPGTTFGGVPVDMKVFIHKIHRGKDLPSVVAGTPYQLGSHDYSGVAFPQPINNCRKCHNGEAGAANMTSEGNNWRTVPTREACGSCHDDVDFATGTNHTGGARADNSQCVVCHDATKIEGYHAAETQSPNAPTLKKDDSGNPLTVFTFEIADVTADATNHPIVKFRIRRDGQNMDLSGTALPAGITGGPSFLIAYALPQGGITTPADYNQLGRSAAQPISVSLATLRAGTAGTLSAPDTNGFYTATFTGTNAWPVGATLRAVALQSYFSQTVTMGGASVTVGRHTASVVKGVTGDASRRLVVDNAKCLGCHESLELHGGGRMNETGVCVMCHNPSLTSSGRATDPVLYMAQVGGTGSASAVAGSQATYQYFEPAEVPGDPADPLTWPEESMQLKVLVHSLHSAAARTTPFAFVRDRGASGALVYDFSHVKFPQINGNCRACHRTGTYDVQLPDNVLPTTHRITTGNAAETRADILAARGAVPTATDQILSPTMAACTACHDSFLGRAHMIQNGGTFNLDRASWTPATNMGQNETCVICHGPGRTADVEVMHPIR